MANQYTATATPWDENRTQALKRMVAAGLSAQKIANALGGTSRSAIIGKARRMKLTLKTPRGVRGKAAEQPKEHDPKKVRQSTRQAHRFVFTDSCSQPSLPTENAPAKPAEPAIDPFMLAVSDSRVSIMDLQFHHCRWPLAETLDATIFYCGNNRLESLPYCIGHASIAYRPGHEGAKIEW